MTGFLAILALGFFLGMRHATDPDHVIAVTTIVARHRTTGAAAMVGAIWGLGHTLTILVVGGGIILFRWVIPPRVGLSMEFSVALMLILLGAMNLSGLLNRINESVAGLMGRSATLHSHAHSHGDYVHTHVHGHEPESHPHDPHRTPVGWLDRHFGALGVYHAFRPLVVGVVHGLAGSAAVALLVLTAIGNQGWAVLYLLIFGVGTIVGMMLVTAAIGLPFVFGTEGTQRFNRGIRVASGLISLGFGCFLAYRVGVIDGLFAAHPQWTPH